MQCLLRSNDRRVHHSTRACRRSVQQQCAVYATQQPRFSTAALLTLRLCCDLQGPLVTSNSSEAAAQLAAIQDTKSAIQRTKQADKAVAILASQLYSSDIAKAEEHAAQLHAAGASAVTAEVILGAAPPSSISAYYSAPPQPAPVLPARSELLQWKQQLRRQRAWHMRSWMRSITRAALHSARGRDMQVSSSRGYVDVPPNLLDR
jgi:hypothetical protein